MIIWLFFFSASWWLVLFCSSTQWVKTGSQWRKPGAGYQTYCEKRLVYMCLCIDQTRAPKWVSLPVTLKEKWGQKYLFVFCNPLFQSYWPQKSHCVPLASTIFSILLIKSLCQQLLTGECLFLPLNNKVASNFVQRVTVERPLDGHFFL